MDDTYIGRRTHIYVWDLIRHTQKKNKENFQVKFTHFFVTLKVANACSDTRSLYAYFYRIFSYRNALFSWKFV